MKALSNILMLLFACTVQMAAANWGGHQGDNDVIVSGVVTSAEDGQPLVGVAVMSGPTNGVMTLDDGSYSIAAPAGSVIVFSSIGFQKYEYTVPSGAAAVTCDVTLETDQMLLDDVVVIAYGVRKKGTVAGSVATVNSEKLADAPTAAFDQALQGQVAGLTVIASSGEPSEPVNMTIRGTNSINSGTEPLYVLDGTVITASDFSAINPSDIASISVLKDASSSSIYGARAANGVVVITTKRGAHGEKPVINFRMQLGFSDIAEGKWNLMDTAERIEYEKQVGLTAGKDYDALSKIDVNWLDEVYNKAAMLQSYELSVSGATETTNYYISGGYYDQEGVAVGSLFDRYSLRANIEQKAAKWLKVGTNTMLNYQNIERAVQGDVTLVTPISAAMFMLPYWDPRREDGSIASIEDGSWKGDGQNPLEWMENNPVKYKRYKVLSSVFAEATIIKGLTFRSQFSVDYTHSTGLGKSYPEYSPNLGEGTVQRNSTDALVLSISNTLNYNFDLDNTHFFNFMVGQDGINSHYEAFNLTAKGQTNNKLTDISSATRVTSWGDTVDDDYGLLSFFGRGEYNYRDRYYADFSVRADASSRFGKNNKWGAFWSVAFMWNLLGEDFMAPSRSWLTFAQISASTGTTGNSSIPNYDHLALIGSNGNYVGDPGITPIQQGVEDLSWESTWATNIGFHFGFWNRLNVDLELYNKKTTNMLMSVPQSYSDNGFGYRWANVGAMVNRGAELNLNGTVFQTRDFTWSLNANVSYNANKITELYNGVDEYELSSTNMKYVVGHQVGEFYINRFAGVNPANGDALWYTRDGEITNELRDEDRVMTGKSMNAPWAGGFGTTLSWKGLSLTAQFSWVADRWMINNDRYYQESNGRFVSYNQSRVLLDAWKQPGDITEVPRYGEYMEFDDRLLEDASFMRLKNLMLSYSLPSSLLSKTRFISGLRIYAQAQNLFTFSGFKGLDPESPNNIYVAQYPMTRQFTFGLDLTF